MSTLPISTKTNNPKASTNPNITYLHPQYFPNHHSERVKIKYGPFLVPGNDMAGFQLRNVTKPCSDCKITFFQADLEYEDGSYANANTGMWLHHMVLLNPTQRDTVCPTHPERIFASGNERTAANICVDGTKEAGYHLTPTSTLLLTTELMNETPHPTFVYITVTYEYIPSPPPTFRPVKIVWLDIGSCSESEYPVPVDETAFSITAAPWIADISGDVLFAAAHPHDGGVELEVLRGGEGFCTSMATYGGTEGYREGDGMEHISSMSVCTGLGRMDVGAEWGVVARYDLNEHAPMVGLEVIPEPIMGIALLYVAQDGA
ncbi:uncharacterized protein LY89DRAFT_730547 [Mollisia scopiformis]|uniref:Uncharacterized protein n=1 Tax=Mollisia scopiformis TaxID=149040 RepID=A0A194XJV6_MOLSC|nr:uncharacterized protein LY89DRAFT_730547 [Mollisia scopiformis]KUJ20510.1 hypothetical protein LY89DRAFT_730547 [Mollisia scopiformis]